MYECNYSIFFFLITVSRKRWRGRRSTRQTWAKCTEAVCTACTRRAVKHPWPRLISRANRTSRARTTALTAYLTIQRPTWGCTLTRDTISRKATAPWCRGTAASRKLQGINRITLKKDLYVTETCWRDAGYRMRKIEHLISFQFSFLFFFPPLCFFFTYRLKKKLINEKFENLLQIAKKEFFLKFVRFEIYREIL